MLVLPRLVAAHPAEFPGGYSDSFQLEGEVNQVKTFTLPDLLLQSHNWTRVKDFFLAGSGSDSGTFTGILLRDLLQEAQVIVDPARRNDLSRKSVLITKSDCYEQCLGGSHQIIVAFLRDDVLLDDGEGMARIINSGDKAGARRVRNITHIRVLTPPPL
jgi:hypothetical protein